MYLTLTFFSFFTFGYFILYFLMTLWLIHINIQSKERNSNIFLLACEYMKIASKKLLWLCVFLFLSLRKTIYSTHALVMLTPNHSQCCKQMSLILDTKKASRKKCVFTVFFLFCVFEIRFCAHIVVFTIMWQTLTNSN